MIDREDGYHHQGAVTELQTSAPLAWAPGEGPAVMRAILASWTQPLDAHLGPAYIELNVGTAVSRTDMYAELTPA